MFSKFFVGISKTFLSLDTPEFSLVIYKFLLYYHVDGIFFLMTLLKSLISNVMIRILVLLVLLFVIMMARTTAIVSVKIDVVVGSMTVV